MQVLKVIRLTDLPRTIRREKSKQSLVFTFNLCTQAEAAKISEFGDSLVYIVPCQPGLHSENLSQNKRKQNKTKNGAYCSYRMTTYHERPGSGKEKKDRSENG